MPLPSPIITTSRPILQSDLESSFGDTLSASAGQAFGDLPVPSAYRLLSLTSARTDGSRLDQQTALGRIKDAGLEGRLKVDESGISEPALDILIDRKREEIKRQEVLSRAPSGIAAGAYRLGTAFATSLLDPINVGLAFVPVVGEARYARYLAEAKGVLGRAGVRAAVGAAEGAVGAAVAEPLVYAAKRQEQADYDFTDSLLNVAFGTVFGGGLHVLAGGASDAFRSFARRPLERVPEAPARANAEPSSAVAERVAEPIPEPGSAAARVADLPLEQREPLLRTAVAQAMQGKSVDVEPIAPRNFKTPDPSQDSILQFLAKHSRGLSSTEALSQGIDKADLSAASSMVGIKRAFRKDGMSFDQAAEMLAEAGYPVTNSEGQYDVNVLLDRIDSELRGKPQYSTSNSRALKEFELEANARAAEYESMLAEVQSDNPYLGDYGPEYKDMSVLASRAAKYDHDAVEAILESLADDSYVQARLEEIIRNGERGASPKVQQSERGGAVYDSETQREAIRASERQASPDAEVTADVRASEAADRSLEEAGPPPSSAEQELAQQEQLLADEMAEVQEAAKIAGVDINDDLADFDELIKQADLYSRAARAAVLCGVGH